MTGNYPAQGGTGETRPHQPVTIGQIVHYKLSEQDVERIVQIRMSAEGHGNTVHEGDIFPAMIVYVGWTPDGVIVNLQVFLDGDHVYWATSRHEGDTARLDGIEPGTWQWPSRI